MQKNQQVNYKEAMKMLNGYLQEMESEMSEVNQMALRGNKKKMATHMNTILKQLKKHIAHYEKHQRISDFNQICNELEGLKPAFNLNYDEICYNKGLHALNKQLKEMEKELERVDKMQYSGEKWEKVQKMHNIYDSLSHEAQTFANSHNHHDFKSAIEHIQECRPEFTLNYKRLIA